MKAAPNNLSLELHAYRDRFAMLRCDADTERTQGLDLKRIRVTSSAAWWMRLSLGAWLNATAAHEERYLQQARCVRRKLGID